MWIIRGSLVLLLKIIMIKKEFNEKIVYDLIDQVLEYSDGNYIEKAIGWLLKTCSKYNPELIYKYLMKNKEKFSRLILRYSSEKLAKEKRSEILKF